MNYDSIVQLSEVARCPLEFRTEYKGDEIEVTMGRDGKFDSIRTLGYGPAYWHDGDDLTDYEKEAVEHLEELDYIFIRAYTEELDGKGSMTAGDAIKAMENGFLISDCEYIYHLEKVTQVNGEKVEMIFTTAEKVCEPVAITTKNRWYVQMNGKVLYTYIERMDSEEAITALKNGSVVHDEDENIYFTRMIQHPNGDDLMCLVLSSEDGDNVKFYSFEEVETVCTKKVYFCYRRKTC